MIFWALPLPCFPFIMVWGPELAGPQPFLETQEGEQDIAIF
jgi:hypothetical protein